MKQILLRTGLAVRTTLSHQRAAFVIVEKIIVIYNIMKEIGRGINGLSSFPPTMRPAFHSPPSHFIWGIINHKVIILTCYDMNEATLELVWAHFYASDDSPAPASPRLLKLFALFFKSSSCSLASYSSQMPHLRIPAVPNLLSVQPGQCSQQALRPSFSGRQLLCRSCSRPDAVQCRWLNRGRRDRGPRPRPVLRFPRSRY